MDHHRKNMVLTKAVWLLFGLCTAYGSVLRTYPYPSADYFTPSSVTLPNDCINNVTAIVIPPAPEIPLHVSTTVVENQLVNEGFETGHYEEHHEEQHENEAILTVIPPAPKLPPFTSQDVVKSKNQFDAQSAPRDHIILEPVIIPEDPVLVADKHCDCTTEEVPQSPVHPFVVVVDDQSAIQDSVQSVVIPQAPELPPIYIPDTRPAVFVEEQIKEVKPVFIPHAPELPPLVLPELPPRVYEEKVIETRPYPPALPEQPCEVEVVVAEPIVEVKPVVIPPAPELPPLVLPELPPRVYEEKVIETRPYPPALPEQPCDVEVVVAEPIVEVKPVVIPPAPELPPLVLPELPPRVYEEKVIETHPYPPALPEQPCDVEVVVAEPIIEVKPVVIPPAPELPPLVLPELPPRVYEDKVIETRPYPPALPEQPCNVEVVVAEPIVEVKPVVIPPAPELPPLVLPELPPHVYEEKVIETRPYPPALPEQPCDVEVVVAEPIVEVKPVVIPPAPELPPLVIPELPPHVYEDKVIETRPYPPALPEQPCNVEVVVAEPIVEVKPVVIPPAPELPPLVLPELPPHVYEDKVIETRPYPPALPEQPCDVEVVVAEPIVEVKPVVIPPAPELPPLVLPELPPHVYEDKVIETRPYPPALPEQPCDVEVVVAEPIVEVKPVVIPSAPELPHLVLPELPPRIEVVKPIVVPRPPQLPTHTINEEEYSNVNVIVPVVPKLPECVKTEIPIILQERIVDRIVTYPSSKYGIHIKPLESSYNPLTPVNLIPGPPAKK